MILIPGVSITNPQTVLKAAAAALIGGQILFPDINGNIIQDSNLFWDNTNKRLGVKITTPLAPIHVGNQNINNSVDSQILISRLVDDTTPAGNSHAFADSSNIDKSGTIGYNSYDDEITISGNKNYNHFAGFQFVPTYGSSGTVTTLYGIFCQPVQNAGVITNYKGIHIGDIVGASKSVLNSYGIYIDSLSVATNNFGIYQTGAEKNYFAGFVGIGTSNPHAQLHVSSGIVDLQTCLRAGMLGTLAFADMVQVQGTWAQANNASQTDFDDIFVTQAGGIINTVTHTNLDEIKLPSVTLNAGTYEIKVVTLQTSDQGILEVLFGTTSIGTADQFNAGAVFNAVNTFTFSPTSRGTQDLRFRVNGKNASSSAYQLFISRIQIRKTA